MSSTSGPTSELQNGLICHKYKVEIMTYPCVAQDRVDEELSYAATMD